MASKLQKTFSNRLRQFVETSGGQAEVARRGGFTRQYLNKVLASKSSPSLDTLERLAAAVEREPYELILTEDSRFLAEERERAFVIVRDALKEGIEGLGLTWPPDLFELVRLLFEMRKDSFSRDPKEKR